MLLEVFSFALSVLDVPTGLLLIAVSLVAWLVFFRDSDLPPGPRGLPLVGYLPFMAKSPHPEETFAELTRKYGKVWSLKMGNRLVVVLGSWDAIKEALVKQGDNFTGRPQGSLMRIRDDESNVVVNDGDIWREHRRFALSTLRDFGMGKNSLEPRITEEIHFFLDEIANEGGKEGVDFSLPLSMSTANVVATLEFGKRFDYADERFRKLLRIIDEMIGLFGSLPLTIFFPWTKRLSFLEPITHYQEILKIDDTFKGFIRDLVAEHEATHEENSRRDYTDAYLTERKSIVDKTGSDGYFNHKELVGNLQNLYGAGTETTATTIRWAVLYLLLQPEVQARVHREIDDVIGMERAPTMADKSRMPYTDAVLMEAARCGSVLPLGVFHSNMEETTLFGYRIPKRTAIMPMHWAAHMDPTLWKNPENFEPERFLNETGDEARKPEYLIPFGTGKRSCLGESLARMELFLYFASMLQRFAFFPPDGTEPSLDYESKAVRRPKPYKVKAVQREGYQVPY